MDKKIYSITAYKIDIKEREKAPKGFKMDELKNCSKYITDKDAFINDFISYLNSLNYKEKNNYFKLTPSRIGNGMIDGVFIEVLYGRNGREFLTIDQYNNEEKHDEKTKYICYYKIYFFEANNNLFMVTF